MDISDAILAKSDQINAIDLIEPVTVTVVEVREGNAEQPVHIITDIYGKGRPFKPSKTVLRDLGKAWGKDTQPWVGRRMELFNEPSVLWAGKPVGGIRVSALSHIPAPIQTAHTITRGKYKEVTIRVLGADELAAHRESLNAASNLTELQIAWAVATKAGVARDAGLVALKDARKAELMPAPVTDDPEHPDFDPALIGMEQEK